MTLAATNWSLHSPQHVIYSDSNFNISIQMLLLQTPNNTPTTTNSQKTHLAISKAGVPLKDYMGDIHC